MRDLPDKIAISGPMRSGKGTLASQLEDYGYHQAAIADYVKFCALRMMKDSGCDMMIPELWLEYPEEHYSDINLFVEQRKTVYRPLLQGMAFTMRKVNPYMFVNALLVHLQPYMNEKIVVSDLRFVDEAKSLREAGFYILRLKRDQQAVIKQLVDSGLSAAEATKHVTDWSEQLQDEQFNWDMILETDNAYPNVLSEFRGKLG